MCQSEKELGKELEILTKQMSEAKQKDAVNNININVNINERDSSKQEIAKTKQEMCRAKKRQKTI